MNYIVVIQATDQLRFTLKIELASNTAKPMKTAPAPDAAAKVPAVAGTRNWPNLLPIKRADTASARSLLSVFCETKDIVSGCPTPSEKPAMKTIAPNVIGVWANAIAPQHTVEIIVLHHSNWNVEKRWLSLPKKNLDIIVVPARIARIAPIAYGEKLFSVPNNGKKTTKTSATDEIASEI